MTERLKRMGTIVAATLILAGCAAPKSGGTGTGAGGGNPVNPGPPQKIHLVWQTNQWKVSLNGGPPVDPATAKTDLARNTVGPTKFVVDIQGSNPRPTFSNDPLWVWEGQGKKNSPQQGIKTTQILGPVMANDGTLVFWDLNQGDPVTLNYRFNFNGVIPPVDPIIDNGGHD